MGRIFDKGRIKYELVFSEILGLNRLIYIENQSQQRKKSFFSYQGIIISCLRYFTKHSKLFRNSFAKWAVNELVSLSDLLVRSVLVETLYLNDIFLM